MKRELAADRDVFQKTKMELEAELDSVKKAKEEYELTLKAHHVRAQIDRQNANDMHIETIKVTELNV